MDANKIQVVFKMPAAHEILQYCEAQLAGAVVRTNPGFMTARLAVFCLFLVVWILTKTIPSTNEFSKGFQSARIG